MGSSVSQSRHVLRVPVERAVERRGVSLRSDLPIRISKSTSLAIRNAGATNLNMFDRTKPCATHRLRADPEICPLFRRRCLLHGWDATSGRARIHEFRTESGGRREHTDALERSADQDGLFSRRSPCTRSRSSPLTSHSDGAGEFRKVRPASETHFAVSAAASGVMRSRRVSGRAHSARRSKTPCAKPFHQCRR